MKYIFSFLLLICVFYAKANDITKVSPDSTAPVHAYFENDKLSVSFARLLNLLQSDSIASSVLMFTKNLRPVKVHFFPGRTNKNALVIAGVHGSELSAIEVANQVISNLAKGKKPYYNVIVIPCLFPDNKAMAEQHPDEIGSTKNTGRYTNDAAADPNRQMPPLGVAFDESLSGDMAGRMIESENQLLLQLIQVFKPERIASLHAIRNPLEGGVYADPRTDCQGYALGYREDSTLALQMATCIKSNGGKVPGNHLLTRPTSLYYCDPAIAPAGEKQSRNIHGSKLPGNRGYGVSLGSWASTSVCGKEERNQREAATLLTIEFPGNGRPQDYKPEERSVCHRNIEAFATAIASVFVQASQIYFSK